MSSFKYNQTSKKEDYSIWLQQILGKRICSCSINKSGHLSITVKKQFFATVVGFLKKHTNCQLQGIVDLIGVDFFQENPRFQVSVELVSFRFNSRIQVKTFVNESDFLPSISHLFTGAAWLEREVFDLFGIYFSGNKDLRRILTDYGFEGNPLRKDFPLSGFYELKFDYEKKRVVQDPVEISQSFRQFLFLLF